jgi:hypothetical protein
VRCRRTGIGFPKTRQAAKVNLRRVPAEEPGYVRRLRAVRHAAIATQARRIVHPMSDGASANVMRVGEVSPRATCRRKFRDYNKFICINRSSPAWGPCVRLPRGRESKRGASHHVGVELLLRHPVECEPSARQDIVSSNRPLLQPENYFYAQKHRRECFRNGVHRRG